ncbi:MAG: sodium-dependent transporter [Acidiferrobacterales bacterium]
MARIKATKSVHGLWSSSGTFVLAATGFTIGLNNIWQFPYHAVQYGGGAFIVIYAIFVFLLGLPLMVGELMLGRLGRLSPVNTIRDLIRRARLSHGWLWLGALSVVSGFLVLSYYSVIAGWLLAYVARSAGGVLNGLNADSAASTFSAFVDDPEKQLFWHSLFMVMTMAVVARGVRYGLESVTRIVVPVLLVLLVLLAIYAAVVGDIVHCVDYFFVPNFLKLSGKGVLTALGDAFFSLGLGVGVMMMYGAYLPVNTSIARAAALVVLIDTITAIVAGVAVLPVLYSGGGTPAEGPALAFRALTVSFDALPLGALMRLVFFVLLVLVAWTSSIALAEPVVAWLIESRGMNRARASIVTGLCAWFLGIITILSFNQWKFSFQLFGITKSLGLFDVMEVLTSSFLMPVTGMLAAIFSAWVLSTVMTRETLAMRSQCTYDAWLWLTRLAVPAWLLIVFFNMRIFQ